jgi:glycosyltransferase involved in cell wall biosynthesis
MTNTLQPHSKRRVLLVSLGYDFGGAEVYLTRLASLLSGDAELFVLCHNPELIENLRHRPVKVIRIPYVSKQSKAFTFLVAMFVLPIIIARNAIDTVQINGYAEAILLIPARLMGCRAISTRHLTLDVTAKWYKHPSRILAWFIYRWAARFASTLVCVSEVVGYEIRELFPSARVTVIPNWIEQIPPDQVPFDRLRLVTRVLFVGRLQKYKGLDLLLDALTGLENVELTVVGDGIRRPEYEARAASLNVRFIGFVSNPSPFYCDADIFVNPSLGPEGSSLVTMEAMAHRTACLVSDLPVFQEIAGGGKAAMLFKVGNAADLKSKLLELLNDKQQRNDYARSGYSYVLSENSPSVAREKYLRVFELA